METDLEHQGLFSKFKNFNRRTRKYMTRIMQEHNVQQSEYPTNVLFVSNSSPLVGVNPECFSEIFRRFDDRCSLRIYPNKSYSFVEFSDIFKAIAAYNDLNGIRPFSERLPPTTMFFIIGEISLPSNKPERNKWPNGLSILEDFITDEEHEELVNFIRQYSSTSFTRIGTMKNRSVIHFGYEFDYRINSADKLTEPIPLLLKKYLKKFVAQGLMPSDFCPNQVTINCYQPGQGIAPHVDTHSAFENQILSLSLLSDIVVEFRDLTNTASISTNVFVPSKSLMMMEGASRYKFKHGILSRKYDINPLTNLLMPRKERLSLTFRRVRNIPCECDFPEFCDWDRERTMAIPRTNFEGEKIENKYVSKVYDSIAESFDQTRYSCWPLVRDFINGLELSSTLLDVGCGNGKNLLYSGCKDKHLIKIGLDISEGLIKIAHKKGCANVLCADALQLPIRSDSQDAVISIAVIHHFSTEDRRLRALEEIVRVLRPNGLALITVWALEQNLIEGGTVYSNFHKNHGTSCSSDEERDANEGRNVISRLVVHDGQSEFKQQDMLIPWWKGRDPNECHDHTSNPKDDYLRYYHLFVRGELDNLIKQSAAKDRCRILSTTHDQGNWVAFIQKMP